MKFRQELKRRNVVRRNTVYAATAFVILELVSIVQEPLNLPEWTLQLVIILLSIGFVISVLVSWIYDFTPEGNLEKTKPLPEENQTDKTASTSPTWRLATYISFALIVGLIVLNLIPRRSAPQSASDAGNTGSLTDKSIAVLPFINDSPDEENAYFINGTMEAILDNLSKIEDLRVVSRTSVEQYRDAPKTIPEVGREMRVAYVLEGSGQKYGNQVRLTMQLIDAAKDEHLWSNPYVREIEVESIFALQSEIAQLVAREIQAVITPEEKQLIEKIPTTSQTAWEFYQRAADMHNKYTDQKSSETFQKAVDLFKYSFEYDSVFALAYLDLAWIYYDRFHSNQSLNKSYLDSAWQQLDLALDLDPQLDRAYELKGTLLRDEGKPDQALAVFDQALKYNPNNSGAYNGKGWIYFNENDYVNAIDNLWRSTQLDMSPDVQASRYTGLGFAFAPSGFLEQAKYYHQEAMKMKGDSSDYYWNMAYAEHLYGNFEEAIGIAKAGLRRQPDRPSLLAILGKCYVYTGQYKESYEPLNRFNHILDSMEVMNNWFTPWVAFAFLKNGFKERAEAQALQQIAQSEEWIAEKRSGYENQYSLLALAYAILGDTDKALTNLDRYNDQERMDIIVLTARLDPIFDSIRDHPEFIRIFDELTSKYEAEHERVRNWLEKSDQVLEQ